MKERKINIVTGATGFIGAALCKELLDADEEVIAVIRPHSKKREKLELLLNENLDYAERFSIIELELENLSKLNEEYEIKANNFYHLAWNGSSGNDRNEFDKQYSNIKYTSEAIKVAKECGCSKFIGAGSQAEYGVVRGIAREGETVPKPFMMYGAAKLAAFQMGQVLAKQIGISFLWPRIYSVYGVGENPGTLVSYVINTLKKGEVPELSHCENVWNFMYITDCVRALRILGESEKAEGIYHIASEDTRVLKEFVKEIRDIVAPEMDLGFGVKGSNPEKTFWLEPDIGRIKELGFGCEVDFGDGIRRKNQREV